MTRLLLILLAISGCAETLTPEVKQDMRGLASACLAAAVLQSDDDAVVVPDVKPLVHPRDCKECGGRGFTIAGDGHRNDCPHCDPNSGDVGSTAPTKGCNCPNCTCDPCVCGGEQGDPFVGPSNTQVAPRYRRILKFTAEWCVKCKIDEPAIELLKKNGWTVGPEESNHIQIVDADAQPELLKKYNVTGLPCYITIENDRVVYRHNGPLGNNPFEFERVYFGRTRR